MLTGFNQICNCIAVEKCQPYQELLKDIEKPLTPQIVQYLRDRQCGFDNEFPMICCFDTNDRMAIPNKVKSK